MSVLDSIPILPHNSVGDLLHSLSASQPNPASFTLSPSLGWLLPSISSNPTDQGNNLSHCSRSACSSIPSSLFIMLAFVYNSNCLREAVMKRRFLAAFTRGICISWPGHRVKHRKWLMEIANASKTQWELGEDYTVAHMHNFCSYVDLFPVNWLLPPSLFQCPQHPFYNRSFTFNRWECIHECVEDKTVNLLMVLCNLSSPVSWSETFYSVISGIYRRRVLIWRSRSQERFFFSWRCVSSFHLSPLLASAVYHRRQGKRLRDSQCLSVYLSVSEITQKFRKTF